MMRTEMEALQRSVLASPRLTTAAVAGSTPRAAGAASPGLSTPGSTPRLLTQTVPPLPPSNAVSPAVHSHTLNPKP